MFSASLQFPEFPDEQTTDIDGFNNTIYSIGRLSNGESSFIKKIDQTRPIASKRIELNARLDPLNQAVASKNLLICDSVIFAVIYTSQTSTVSLISIDADSFVKISESYKMFSLEINNSISWTCFPHNRESILLHVNSQLVVVDKNLEISQIHALNYWTENTSSNVSFVLAVPIFQALISLEHEINGWFLSVHDFSIFDSPSECSFGSWECLPNITKTGICAAIGIVSISIFISILLLCINSRKTKKNTISGDDYYEYKGSQNENEFHSSTFIESQIQSKGAYTFDQVFYNPEQSFKFFDMLIDSIDFMGSPILKSQATEQKITSSVQGPESNSSLQNVQSLRNENDTSDFPILYAKPQQNLSKVWDLSYVYSSLTSNQTESISQSSTLIEEFTSHPPNEMVTYH